MKGEKKKKEDFPDIVNVSKEINRTQNPGLLEDADGVITGILSDGWLRQPFVWPIIKEVAPIFEKAGYSKRLFNFNEKGTWIQVYFSYDESKVNDATKRKHYDDEDDYYYLIVTKDKIAFYGRFGCVYTKRKMKETDDGNGHRKSYLEENRSLEYPRTREGTDDLKADIATTLE